MLSLALFVIGGRPRCWSAALAAFPLDLLAAGLLCDGPPATFLIGAASGAGLAAAMGLLGVRAAVADTGSELASLRSRATAAEAARDEAEIDHRRTLRRALDLARRMVTPDLVEAVWRVLQRSRDPAEPAPARDPAGGDPPAGPGQAERPRPRSDHPLAAIVAASPRPDLPKTGRTP